MFPGIRIRLTNLFSDERFAEILAGSIWTFFAQIIATLLAMISSIYVARIYGVEMTGILALLASFVALATIFTVLGTKTSVLRLIPVHIKKHSVKSAFWVYRKTQYIVVCVSVLTGALGFVSSGWIATVVFSKPDLAPFIALAACFVVAKSILDLNTSAIRGIRLNRVFAVMHVLPDATKLLVLIVGGFLLAGQNIPVYALMASWLVPALVGVIIMQIAFGRMVRAGHPSQAVQDLSVREILSISLPMLMTMSMAFIIGKSGVIILGIFHSEETVGYYAIAVTLSTMTAFILGAVNSMSASKFSELYHSEKLDELFHVAKKSTKLIFWATVPILVILLFLGKPLLSVLYGSTFVTAYPALVLLTIGQFINSISGATGMFMNMTGHQLAMRNIMVVAASINIAMNLLLTPRYGAIGAALSAMFSTIFWNVAVLVFIRRRYGQTLGYLPSIRRPRSSR